MQAILTGNMPKEAVVRILRMIMTALVVGWGAAAVFVLAVP